MTYPAEPWHLEGQMHVSLWLAPRAAIPQDLPPGTRPVTIAGRCPVGTAVVLYEADSVLRYTELLCAVLVRRRARVMPWITEIWVDSPPSRDGGRALWGIPKELASFGVSREMGLRATASDERGLLAEAAFRPALRLPGRWPVSYRVAQTLAGALKATPVRCRSGLGLARARWRIPEDGPLGRLSGRRPLLSVTLHDFSLDFGSADFGSA